MNQPFSSTTKTTADGKNTNKRKFPPSILRKPNDWGSCTQRHSENKVKFVEFTKVRIYQPDLPEGKRMISTGKYIRQAKKKRDFNKSTRFWMICEMLKIWIEDHRKKVEMCGYQSKTKVSTKWNTHKRPASPRPSGDTTPRPNKRRKLNPSVFVKKVLSIPSSVKEWIRCTNKFVAGTR